MKTLLAAIVASAVSVGAFHGSVPASRRCAMIPSAQMSVCGEILASSALVCSGDM